MPDFDFEFYEDSRPLEIPSGTLSLTIMKSNDFKGFSHSKNIAYIDKDLLTWPLKIRNWRDGDKFRPFGMHGIKKVSDFLNDIKVPLSQKKKTPILLNNNEIIWIIGHRMAEEAKISDSTKEIVILTLKPIQQEPDNII